MEVDGVAAIMPVVMLANTFSGQKHFPGVDCWPREETCEAHDHSDSVLSPLGRSQFSCGIF